MVKKLPNDVFDEALTKLDKIVDFIDLQIDKGYITESEAKRIWQEMFRQTKGTWKEGIFEEY
jgi:polyhydroxyalkanoate synthesis regulator phasin